MAEEIKHYISFSGTDEGDTQVKEKRLAELMSRFSLQGTEVYIASVVPREELLFNNDRKKGQLADMLRNWHARRIHSSYWAEPSDLLARVDWDGLVTRFGGEEEVKTYFGDLTGEHIYNRWVQEYELAKEVGAEAVTFHLIDYFHIDGLWQFTILREDVLRAMVVIVDNFIDRLNNKGLLDNGPAIELENAGFGLEYGVQTAQDYVYLFENLRGPSDKLRIAWDTNHLLHAIGFNTRRQRARFFLTDQEITEEMRQLEEKFGHDTFLFAHKWVEMNLLHPQIVDWVSAIHLSDCRVKTEEYFRNGRLTGRYYEKIRRLKTPQEQEEYGVKMVLQHYDSHEHLGVTLKHFPEILAKVRRHLPQLSIVHELKNNQLDQEALEAQFRALGIT